MNVLGPKQDLCVRKFFVLSHPNITTVPDGADWSSMKAFGIGHKEISIPRRASAKSIVSILYK